MDQTNSSLNVAMPLMQKLNAYDLKSFDIIKFLEILNAMNNGIQSPRFESIGNLLSIRYKDIDHGIKEMSLRTSKDRLKYLVKSAHIVLTEDIINNAKAKEEAKKNRRSLVSKDNNERNEKISNAIHSIEDWHGYYITKYIVHPKVWWVLEGPTQPDIYIETDKYIFIGEVKWTEPGPKKNVLYDPDRQQFIRHIEGAFEYIRHQYGANDAKQVFSFFVLDDDFIEKDKKRRDRRPKLDLVSAGDVSMWDNSLKHYDIDVIEKYKQTYIGYITVSQLEKIGLKIQNK